MEIKKYKELSDEECINLNGGHWVGDVLGSLGKLGRPIDSTTAQKALDRLNGKAPKGPARSCGPYGTGGTPNAC